MTGRDSTRPASNLWLFCKTSKAEYHVADDSPDSFNITRHWNKMFLIQWSKTMMNSKMTEKINHNWRRKKKWKKKNRRRKKKTYGEQKNDGCPLNEPTILNWSIEAFITHSASGVLEPSLSLEDGRNTSWQFGWWSAWDWKLESFELIPCSCGSCHNSFYMLHVAYESPPKKKIHFGKSNSPDRDGSALWNKVIGNGSESPQKKIHFVYFNR